MNSFVDKFLVLLVGGFSIEMSDEFFLYCKQKLNISNQTRDQNLFVIIDQMKEELK